MELFFEHYPAAKREEWVAVFAFTISPRDGWSERHRTIEHLTRDFFNRVAERTGLHILPICYKGDQRTGNRPHLHGTIFIRKGKTLSRGHLYAEALTHRAFRSDNLLEAIKPISNEKGWSQYMTSKHNVSYIELSCPRKRGACKGRKRRNNKNISCALMRKLVRSLEPQK